MCREHPSDGPCPEALELLSRDHAGDGQGAGVDRAGLRVGGARIRCPHCAWRPRAESRWKCAPSCGCSWNTFDTQGRCPKCATQWEDTQCHRCEGWSRHLAWYELPVQN